MAHTRPDYTTSSKMEIIYGEVDNGELAARLESIDTFDRRGSVIYLDNFENLLDKWTDLTGGVGAAVTVSTENALSGSCSAKLVTGNAIDDYAQISKLLPYPILGPMGFEAALALDGQCKHIYFTMALYDGTETYTAQIDIEPMATNLSCATPVGAYTVFDPAFTLRQTNEMFHIVKLVADFSTGKYVRFIFDNTSYDLSAYTMDHAAPAPNPSIALIIKITTNVNLSRTSYVDNIIYTQNEP